MQTDQSQHGDMPTTGGARPGPVAATDGPAAPASALNAQGARPIVLRIPAIQVDAEVQRAYIVDGVMEDPTGPFVVAWYGETERVGVPGNAVFAGHVDFVDVGAAVFARVGELGVGDIIEAVAIGSELETLSYAVEWSESYPAATAPVEEILRQTDAEEITLITCGGVFDGAAGAYGDRLIIRAQRVG